MKNIQYLLLTILFALTFNACSSDDEAAFDPYKNQVKRPFYPTTITFNNTNNDGTQIEKKWEITYDNDNIKAYTYNYQVNTSNGEKMTETHVGQFAYYKDSSTGNDIIQNTLTINSSVTSHFAVESYSDIITELADIKNGTIQKITTLGQRTYSNGEKETYKNTQTFTYSDKFCTSSTLTNNLSTTTYTYNWSDGKLNSIKKYQQDKSNNVTQEEYNYTYDSNSFATDYEFNTLAFVYGNMPEIYAAMNLFGATSAYKIESETYSGYRSFAGTTKPIAPINRNYAIFEQSNNIITYTADSPSSTTHILTFSKN